MRKIIVQIFTVLFMIGAYGNTPLHAKDIYYCPMHPHYISDRPGNCAICGMTLVKKEEHAQVSKNDVAGYVAVELSSQKQALAGIRTAVVQKKSVVKTVRAVGQIAYDQDLYKAEIQYVEDYITFERLKRRVNKGSYVFVDAERKLKESESDLIHMGATEQKITQLRQEKLPDHSLVLPDSEDILVYAQIFEGDLGFVDVGQKVIIEAPAYHETYEGAVLSVDPTVDETSRTIRVRIWFKHKNPSQFKAGMLVNVSMPVELNEAIVIPKDAVLDSGVRKIVFVQKDKMGFEPRLVETGWESDDGIAIKSGLKEGEQVIVGGNFLLDSESRMQAALVGMGE